MAGAGLALHTHVPDIAVVEEETGPGSPRSSASGGLLLVDGTDEAAANGHDRRLPHDASLTSVDSAGSGSGSISPGSNGSGVAMVATTATTVDGGAAAQSSRSAAAARKPNPLADLMRDNKLELAVATTVLFLWW